MTATERYCFSAAASYYVAHGEVLRRDTADLNDTADDSNDLDDLDDDVNRVGFGKAPAKKKAPAKQKAPAKKAPDALEEQISFFD